MNIKRRISASVHTSVAQRIVYCYVLFLFGLYPLLYRNGYSDILDFKSSCYLFMTSFMLVLLGAVGLVGVIRDHTMLKVWNGIMKQNSLTDWCVICFTIVLTISWLSSNVLVESFWGTSGRRMGYFVFLLCVISYYVVSRYLQYNQYILFVLIFAGILVFAIAIINFFQIDILRMYTSGWKRGDFISTLGNRNSLASYSSIILPIGMTLFCVCKTKVSSCIYGFFCVIGFMSMVASSSDSVFCAVAVSFLFLFWVIGESWISIKKYLILVILFILSVQLIGSLHHFIFNQNKVVGGIPYLVAFGRKLLLVLPILILIYLGVCVGEKKGIEKKVIKKTKTFLLVIVGIVGFVGFISVIYLNVSMTKEEVVTIFGKLGKYLYFDEYWGSYRGGNWIYSIQMFREFTFKDKLFGYGPGTFLFAIRNTFERNVYSLSGQSVIDAHNEFFQILITIGGLGVISYFGVLGSSIVKYIKNYKENPFQGAIMISLISFLIQGIVNNPHIYTTPLVFAIIGIGEAVWRKNT